MWHINRATREDAPMAEKTAESIGNLGYNAHIYYDPAQTRGVAERAGAAATRFGRSVMLPRHENELLTRIGPETPMGRTMRLYWIPACLSCEIAEPDGPPARVRLLGEDLVAFRDSEGRIGLIDEFCP